jgi:hypothetical protein
VDHNNNFTLTYSRDLINRDSTVTYCKLWNDSTSATHSSKLNLFRQYDSASEVLADFSSAELNYARKYVHAHAVKVWEKYRNNFNINLGEWFASRLGRFNSPSPYSPVKKLPVLM